MYFFQAFFKHFAKKKDKYIEIIILLLLVVVVIEVIVVVALLLYSALKNRGYTGLHLSVRPYVRPLKFFLKDFSTTEQARRVIICIQI